MIFNFCFVWFNFLEYANILKLFWLTQHVVNIFTVLETCILQCWVLGQCMLLTLFASVGLCFKLRISRHLQTKNFKQASLPFIICSRPVNNKPDYNITANMVRIRAVCQIMLLNICFKQFY